MNSNRNSRSYSNYREPRNESRRTNQYQKQVRPERRGANESRLNRVDHAQPVTTQGSQLPGIPVYKSQPKPTTKPFEPTSAPKSDGSGDKLNGADKELSAVTEKLAQIDVNSNDLKEEAVVKDSDNHLTSSTDRVEESHSETTVATNDGLTTQTTPGMTRQYIPRRNTIGEYPSKKPWKPRNEQNFYNKYNQNQFSHSKFKTDQGNRYAYKTQNKIWNQSMARPVADNPSTAPISPIFYSCQDQCSQVPHYYLPPNSYCSANCNPAPTAPSYGMEMTGDSRATPKSIDCGTKGMDQMSGTNGNKEVTKNLSYSVPDPMPIPLPIFIPFHPSPAFPEPPHYWGHIVTCKTDIGLIPYFICDFPNNIAPLQLKVENYCPVLPSNCHIINAHNNY